MSPTMNHIVICGYDAGARILLDTLTKEIDPEKTKLIIFAEGDRHNNIPPEYDWIEGTPTKESSLDKVRLAYAKACIIVGKRSLLPQAADAETILTIFTIRSYLEKHPSNKKRKKPLYISSEILDSENVEHAYTAGANEVIETNHMGFSMISHSITNQGSAKVMSMIAQIGDYNLYIAKPKISVEYPITFGELQHFLKTEYNKVLLGIRKADEANAIFNPPDSFIVTDEDFLVYLATKLAT